MANRLSKPMNEELKEKMLGGYTAYCEVFHAFGNRGLEVIFYENKNILIVGLSSAGIETYKSNTGLFLLMLQTMGAESLAAYIQSSIKSITRRSIETHLLIHSHEPSRVLWAFATIQLGGETGRTYDDCFENGNAADVRRAVGYLNSKYSLSRPAKWTAQLAEKALADTQGKFESASSLGQLVPLNFLPNGMTMNAVINANGHEGQCELF